MTDRRRSRRRRHGHDHLMAGAAIAVLVGAALTIGFDASRRSDFMSSAVVSIDPQVGSGSVRHQGTTTGSPRRIARAGLLPGEIVIETAGVMPPGQWRLGERRISPPPVVLDSVAAGRNALTFTAGDSIRWQAPIDLAPGGVTHVMVPAFDSAAASPPARHAAPATPADAPATPAAVPVPPPAPADSTDAP